MAVNVAQNAAVAVLLMGQEIVVVMLPRVEPILLAKFGFALASRLESPCGQCLFVMINQLMSRCFQ